MVSKILQLVVLLIGILFGFMLSHLFVLVCASEKDSCMDRGFCTFEELAENFCESKNMEFMYVTQGNTIRCEGKNIAKFYNIIFQYDHVLMWE